MSAGRLLQSVAAGHDFNGAISTPSSMADSSPYETQRRSLHQQDDSTHAPDRLLKAAEIQRELGVSRATAYRMMTDGTLPTYRFGGIKGRRVMVRVSLRELRNWLASHRGNGPLPADF